MNQLILGGIGLIVFTGFFERSFSSLTLIGIVALLAHMFRKLQKLGDRVNKLENELSLLLDQSSDVESSAGHVNKNKPSPDPVVSEDVVSDYYRRTNRSRLKHQVNDSSGQNEDPQGDTNTDSDLYVEPPESVTQSELQNSYLPDQSTPKESASNQPSSIERISKKVIGTAWDWVCGGNVFVRVGVIILFMGVSFLMRYAVHQNVVPIELRLTAVAGLAIALLLWGWAKRHKHQSFSLVVQGGGIGLLYLTIFASYSFYDMLDSTSAFLLLGVIVTLAAILAVAQNAKALALFAAIGGFLAPVLVSGGNNNYVGLFSYYTVLNLGIFAVAWFRSWRILNLTGFVFTFAIAGIWGGLSYKPEYYDTTQPFLIIFFLLYVGVSVLFAFRRSINFKDTIDSSLVFGTPLLAFSMQCQLVGDWEYGISISAFVLAAFYLVLSRLLWHLFSVRLTLLCETFLSLSVIFSTIAIPFAIDGSSTAAIWAIEGAGILWLSIRQQQFYRRIFAILLMFAAGAISAWDYFYGADNLFLGKQEYLNAFFIGTVFIAVSASFAAWMMSKQFEGKRRIESSLEFVLLCYSVIVLLAGIATQVIEFKLLANLGNSIAVIVMVVGLLYTIAADRLQWKMANWLALGYFSWLLLAIAISFNQQLRLSENHGYLIWPISIVALYYCLKKCRIVMSRTASIITHCIGGVLLAALLLWEGVWQLLLGYSLSSIVFIQLAKKYDWKEIRYTSLVYLPVLLVAFAVAVILDSDLVTLSNLGAEYYPPFRPGGVLWPMAFITYFYLLPHVRGDVARSNLSFYYAGGGLIVIMLLWLGLWPLLLGATFLCWVAYYLSSQHHWLEMKTLSLWLLPLMLLLPIIGFAFGITNPVALNSFNLEMDFIEQPGLILWPLAFVTLYLIHYLSEKSNAPAKPLTHSVSLLLLVGVSTWILSHFALLKVSFLNPWHFSILPIFGLFAIGYILKARTWPFNSYQDELSRYALIPLALATVVWSFMQFMSHAMDSPLPWVPVLNRIELIQGLILYGWYEYGRDRLKNDFGIPVKYTIYAMAGFVFLWINVDVLRFVHHWTGVEWNSRVLIERDLTQTLFSIVWSVIGLLGTFIATKSERRELWIVSAVLLALVVLKLFVIDLSAQATIERIVSFTGVGLLLTFVGYFSPVPPHKGLPAMERSQ